MNYFFSCKPLVAVMLTTGICCFAATAQEQTQSAMTLRDCMEYAVSDRDGAQAAFHQADKLAEVQKEAFRLSTRQYETGLISAIEYQSASQTYLNAMAERMKSLLQLRIKDAVVRYCNGEPYINQ